MTTRSMLSCESCEHSRRVGGSYYLNRPAPSSPEPLIPVKVLVCLARPGRGNCTCGAMIDGTAGARVACERCGSLVRLEPTRFVNPWECCKTWKSAL
jgi:hypothetical protein